MRLRQGGMGVGETKKKEARIEPATLRLDLDNFDSQRPQPSWQGSCVVHQAGGMNLLRKCFVGVAWWAGLVCFGSTAQRFCKIAPAKDGSRRLQVIFFFFLKAGFQLSDPRGTSNNAKHRRC
jgi:hypothetical protein